MSERLPSDLINIVLHDVSAASTFTNKEECRLFLETEVYDYLTLEDRYTQREKAVIAGREDKKAVSVKLCNFSLHKLLEQLPSDIENLMNLALSGSIVSHINAILYLIRRVGEMLNSFEVQLNKKHEMVFIVIACLSRGKQPISFDSIDTLLRSQRRKDGLFPRIETEELYSVLHDLEKMKCIEQSTQGHFKSVEMLIL